MFKTWNDALYFLFLIPLIQIITGASPLAGNRRVKGIKVRLCGLLVLSLLIVSLFLPTEIKKIVGPSVFILYLIGYFTLKGEECPAGESYNFSVKSKSEEIKTYLDVFKGIMAYAIIISFCFGIIFLVGMLIF